MDINENNYPNFWKGIQDKKRAKSGTKAFDMNKINKELICPMNYLYNLEMPKFRNTQSTLPMSYFFNPQPLDSNRRTNKKVEELIERHSFSITNSLIEVEEGNDDNYINAILEYDELINELKTIHLSKGYLGLTSWLIDRAFCITPAQKQNIGTINNLTNKNKSLFLKILYDINPNNVIKCFSKNIEKQRFFGTPSKI